MHLDNFISSLSFRDLTEKQINNIEEIKKIAEGFHRDAETLEVVESSLDKNISSDTVVLESGHQPNFFPYTGTWKKIYLLDLLKKKLEDQGRDVVALFGLADCNLSNASFLYKNKVPANTRDGCVKVGFKISKEDRFKPFNLVDKPSEVEWCRELENIKKFYLDNSRLDGLDISANIKEVIDLMEESYSGAVNFPDLNAFVFSKVCNRVWGLDVLFFRYSDVFSENIFLDESLKLLSGAKEYNRLHNVAVDKFGGIPRVSVGSLPFWVRCGCGVKIPVNSVEVGCVVCGSKYLVDEAFVRGNFQVFDFTAVSRNLVFSEGLGTALFLSGVGGGFRYGLVSEHVGEGLGSHLPVTLGVGGRDFYMGLVHRILVHTLIKSFGLSYSDLLNKKILESRIAEKIFEVEQMRDTLENKQKYKGLLSSYSTLLNIVRRVFSLTSSVLDPFMCLGLEGVKEPWVSLSDSSIVEEKIFFRLDCGSSYGLFEGFPVRRLFDCLSNIEVLKNV